MLSATEKLSESKVVSEPMGMVRKWLAGRDGKSPLAVIDGANVGFFGQRPDRGGKISFRQIDMVRQHFQDEGYQPIIFLHERHGKRVRGEHASLLQKWRQRKQVFETPFGCNDDWFWLYAGQVV